MAPADAHVRDWLKALGSLIAPSMTEREFVGRVNVLAAALAREFPPGAYSPASLAHVARQCKFFPNFAELCEYLSHWWKDHRPAPENAIEGDGWQEIQERREATNAATWRNISAHEVTTKVRNIEECDGPFAIALGRTLAAALDRYAPQHLGLLRPEWLSNA